MKVKVIQTWDINDLEKKINEFLQSEITNTVVNPNYIKDIKFNSGKSWDNDGLINDKWYQVIIIYD